MRRGHGVERLSIDDLNRGGDDARGQQAGHGTDSVRNVHEARLHRRLNRRFGDEPKRDLRDDGEGAFRSDQQLREVVADDVLDGFRSCANDFARREDGLECEDVALGGAVFDRTRPSRTFRNVATERRLLQACRVWWIEQPARFDCFLQFVRDDVGLHDREQVLFIDRRDPVQLLHRQHHAAANWHSATCVARAGAANDER